MDREKQAVQRTERLSRPRTNRPVILASLSLRRRSDSGASGSSSGNPPGRVPVKLMVIEISSQLRITGRISKQFAWMHLPADTLRLTTQ